MHLLTEENRRDSEEAERDIIQLLWELFGSVKTHYYSGEFRFLKLGLKSSQAIVFPLKYNSIETKHAFE